MIEPGTLWPKSPSQWSISTHSRRPTEHRWRDFKPRKIVDLVVSDDSDKWKPAFEAALRQQRLWENRTASREPPRKVPYKFQYQFECDDVRCNGKHRMMIEDWEVGALYWRCINNGARNTPEAAAKVKQKFLDQLCSPDRDTHFFVGTILAHPKSWVVIGVFWPKSKVEKSTSGVPSLFAP